MCLFLLIVRSKIFDITQMEYNYVLIYDGDLIMWGFGIYCSYFLHPGRRTECTKRKKGQCHSHHGLGILK